MNEDDLYEPRLSPAPSSSPTALGVAAVIVTVSMAVAGCGTQNPGVQVDASERDAGADSGSAPVWDAGIINPDASR